MGGGEREGIHLSLSPELLYRAGKLPPDLRQMFKSSPAEKVLSFWSGCSLQTQRHLVSPGLPGLGGSCVCYIMSDPLFEFLPSLSHSYRQTQTDIVWWGHAVASRCVRSSAYLESICLLPLTDPETAGLSVASLSVSFMTGVEKSGKKRRVWEMMRWGRRERGR